MRVKLFWEYFSEDKKNEVLENLKRLSKIENKSLFEKYGENLDEFNRVSEECHKYCKSAILKLQKIITNPKYKTRACPVVIVQEGKKKEVYLKEKLSCDSQKIEELAALISDISDFDILKSYYGENLDEPLDEFSITQEEIEKLRSIYLNLKKKINKKRETLLEVLSATTEEIIYLRNRYFKESDSYLIITTLFGEDWLGNKNYIIDLTKESRTKYYNYLKKLRACLDELRKKPIISGSFTLKKLLNCSEREFKKATDIIKDNSFYNIFFKYFKDNLNQTLNLGDLSNCEYAELMAKIDNLTSIIKGKHRSKNKSAEEKIVVQENNQVVNAEEIPNFESADENKNNNDNLPVEILTKYSYETVSTPLTHPFFKEFVKLLPIQYQLITSLRLGLYDGKIHSIQEIAEIFNLDLSTTKEALSKSVMLFSFLVERYVNIFGVSFPNLSHETDLALLLLKDFKSDN